MTPETFIIILAIIITIAVISVFGQIFSKPERDYAARDRDRGLAKLYEARADVLHVESLERKQVLARLADERRERVCKDVRDARGGGSSS